MFVPRINYLPSCLVVKNAILLIGAAIVNVCARAEKDQVQGSPFTRRRRRHAPLQVLCFNYSPVARVDSLFRSDIPTWVMVVPRTSQRMEKLKEDLNIFILDDSNIHQMTTAGFRQNGAAVPSQQQQQCRNSPVRISFTPPPIRPLDDGHSLMLNRIVANGINNAATERLDKLDTDDSRRVDGHHPERHNHIATVGGDHIEGGHRGNCCGNSPAALRIDSNNIESLISDDEYFPHNDIPGKYALYYTTDGISCALLTCIHSLYPPMAKVVGRSSSHE